MRTSFLSTLFLCLVFTGIGLICGLFAGAGDTAGAGAEPDSASQTSRALAPETLRNMGVRIEQAELADFVQTTKIPAVIEAAPATLQYLYAPIAGRVDELWAQHGALVHRDEVLVTLIRDPMDRAQLTFTQNLFEPAGETLHEAMRAYLAAAIALENVTAERSRVEAVTGPAEDPLIPTSRLIALRYEERLATQRLANLQHELGRHGLSEEQIGQLEGGILPTLDVELWRSAMKNNGLWTAHAQRIYDALPTEIQNLAWTVATIGELVAGGFATEQLAELFEQNEHARLHLLEIGGVLQRGHSLADVRDLLRLDVFDDLVQVRAPTMAEDWDVVELLVRPGEHVVAGQPLLRLENPRPLYLRVEPVGGEVAQVMAALENGTSMTARSMVPGAAPPLEGLTFFRAAYETADCVVALCAVTNQPLALRREGRELSYRTWVHGEGQRYLLELPRAVQEDVYVLPATAVTEDGPDSIVYLQSGDTFKPLPVELLYRDHEVVVIPGDSRIFPGNPIVVSGAFALGLALHSTGAGSEMAGHRHAH